MPISPQPFKVKCQKCGYSKVVAPKSDALSPLDFITTCPKCGGSLEKVELNILDTILTTIKGSKWTIY